MAMKNCMLGAFVVALGGVAQAAPQRVGIKPLFPITNASTPAPKPTGTDPACEAACEVRYPELYGLSWVPEAQIVFTETITVGTVSVMTVTDIFTTVVRTNTVYNDDIPKWFTLYQQSTNAAGTKVVEAGITLSDGYTLTTFAYPTPWVDYPSQYHWQGVLPTHDENYTPICATATELAMAEVTPHPLYPQPTDVIADQEDPEGANHVPVWVPLRDLPDKKWFNNAFPLESAYASCEPVAGKEAPVDISTAKFALWTATFVMSFNNPFIIHKESSVTGWEETTTKAIHRESSVTGWEETTTKAPDVILSRKPDSKSSKQVPTPSAPPTLSPPRGTPTSIPIPDIPRIESTVSVSDTAPRWQQSLRPSAPGQPHVHRPSTNGAAQPTPPNDNGNGDGQPGNNGAGQQILPPAPTRTTPVFTFVPTTINGQPTAVPAFILPDSSTATLGQTVTLNGQPTVLAAPPAIFAIVPTTLNNIPTSTPAFIISGTSTATIGQTITLDGQPTVLAAPPPYTTVIPTTINGIQTSITAYIISGSITALPGQTVTVNGQLTTLPTADAVFTTIPTTIDGTPTAIPAYIISGSMTATLGQTVIIDGTRTVLSAPTAGAGAVFTSITTTVNGVETVVPVYIIGGSMTATLGQTVTIGGETTVLESPSPTGMGASAGARETADEGRPVETGDGGEARETGDARGVGARGVSVEWMVGLVGVGALLCVMWV